MIFDQVGTLAVNGLGAKVALVNAIAYGNSPVLVKLLALQPEPCGQCEAPPFSDDQVELERKRAADWRQRADGCYRGTPTRARLVVRFLRTPAST